ncbi:MAG TPA: transglutaminase domain-containing protein [Prolixibacteraceae bacterium]|nr:transglutaminase domain-containing protein [Prolixibacteraceae bacterium]
MNEEMSQLQFPTEKPTPGNPSVLHTGGKKCLFLVLAIFVSGLSFSISPAREIFEEPDWKQYLEADRWARSISYNDDPGSLARLLTGRFDNIYLKYKALYSWIAFHVSYDTEGLQGQRTVISEPLMVLDSLKAVCSGYANLMCLLCHEAGLECVSISGWAKNTEQHLMGIDRSKPDHAWNAIRINQQWRYCDVTWGAGFVRNQSEFIPFFTSAWFNLSAERCFLQHYPMEAAWQKEYPMTFDAFDAQPLYSASYFTTWTDGITQQNKVLRKGFLCSCWIRFESRTPIRSIEIMGTSRSFPLLRMGNDYLFGFDPGKKGNLQKLCINSTAIVTYLYP